jgi:hypothetical protein
VSIVEVGTLGDIDVGPGEFTDAGRVGNIEVSSCDTDSKILHATRINNVNIV